MPTMVSSSGAGMGTCKTRSSWPFWRSWRICANTADKEDALTDIWHNDMACTTSSRQFRTPRRATLDIDCDLLCDLHLWEFAGSVESTASAERLLRSFFGSHASEKRDNSKVGQWEALEG
mmetsp:Transcript_7064/g.16899  ORF Transcript_7064/g.16899 Transcript_7064/m.16899 type:complete len:120 (-) Transcript_7064:92-451(-)